MLLVVLLILVSAADYSPSPDWRCYALSQDRVFYPVAEPDTALQEALKITKAKIEETTGFQEELQRKNAEIAELKQTTIDLAVTIAHQQRTIEQLREQLASKTV